MATQGIAIREALASDLSFVRNSWCKASYSHLSAQHYLSHHGRAPHYSVYKPLFDGVIDRICYRSTISVAVNDDDHDQILGFCVHAQAEQPILHYVQVKKELWRNGIAATMLEHAGIDKRKPCIYTFTSPILAKWRAPDKWQHIPHWLLETT